ncbi:MAG: hypothetical protein ACTSVV_19220 [Promethearchaeota archaeon]
MHFLRKLIETPILEDPGKKHMDIHRHFYRYSRGEFIGPALKITKTGSRITLKGSFEYEDLIQELVAESIPDDEVNINGVLISGKDVSDIITNLGLNWTLKKSTGKTKNYKATFSDKISKKTLLECINAFRPNSYLLLSFNVNPTCKVTTKKTIPQPSKKKVEEDDINKRIQFCSGVLVNNERNLEKILDNALPDVKTQLPEKWKTILITNTYKIEEVELPKNVENSALLRILAVRKGKIIRSIEVDGDLIENQFSFVA